MDNGMIRHASYLWEEMYRNFVNSHVRQNHLYFLHLLALV